MKKIIIHIGPPKTGSSALQFCLKRNADYLRRNGIWYPIHPTDANSVSSGNRDVVLSKNPVSASNSPAWVVDKGKATGLLEELERSSCSVLLLSSEYFWNQVPELQSVFPQAKFIAYLRGPIDLLESNYNQGVKRHGDTAPFSARKNVEFKTLDLYSAIYRNNRECNLKVRAYSEELFIGQRIEKDFFSELGLECHKLNPEKVNRSYSFEALEFKRMANHFELGKVQAALDRALQGCRLGNFDYSLILPQKYKRLHRRYLKQLDSFIEEFSQPGLERYRVSVESTKQKPYLRQKPDLESFRMIGDYLRESQPSVYIELQSIVKANESTALPCPEFYDCFDKKAIQSYSGLTHWLKRAMLWRSRDQF